ncbi:MAG: YceI family protein [Bacteroidota bacterium]
MKQLFIFLLLLQINGAAAQEIDMDKSSILFTVTNIGLEVEGKFRAFSGEISFDPDHPEQSTFEISIPVNSIHTKNRMRDEHLMEEEFFDVASYPVISFSSPKIEKQDDHYLAIGMLTIKGKSQEISIPFRYKDESLSGTFKLNRQDYNIGGSGFLDTIGDEVSIQISCAIKPTE